METPAETSMQLPNNLPDDFWEASSARLAEQRAALWRMVKTQGICATLGIVGGALFVDKKHRICAIPTSPAPFVDTHGHLSCLRTHSASVALARAALAGVRVLVSPADPLDEIPSKFATPAAYVSWIDAQIEDAHKLLELCANEGLMPPTFAGYESAPALLDAVYVVAGVHPYGVAQYMHDKTQSRVLMQAFLTNPRCRGVGEIGIDFGPYNSLDAGVQADALLDQLMLARAYELPVELHVRNDAQHQTKSAHNLVYELLEQRATQTRAQNVAPLRCELHCFTEDAPTMQRFTDKGIYVAFGGASSFARSQKIRQAAAACPEHLILSETDAPYMAPVPVRGRECESAMVGFTAGHLARVREEQTGITKHSTYQALWDNAHRFFALGLA